VPVLTGFHALAHALLRQPASESIRFSIEESCMNWDRIEGNWKQFKGKVKEEWGGLTDDQLDVIAGRRDQLAGKLQEAYGIGKDEAERQIGRFEARYRDWNPEAVPPVPHIDESKDRQPTH
jgi:uncharacterized protein YjbJ (UPF0337 family)